MEREAANANDLDDLDIEVDMEREAANVNDLDDLDIEVEVADTSDGMTQRIEADVKKCMAGINLLPIVIVQGKVKGQQKRKKRNNECGEEVRKLLAERSKFKGSKNKKMRRQLNKRIRELRRANGKKSTKHLVSSIGKEFESRCRM